ncbi:uncharacterized protein LOC132266353 [Cornus florida]|uniref:uncharacterized protein LOC132266353 n=1 Tax=Cornus florida TaxID=4283 RepID=UPI00289C10BE|nr:uncharacterized protein LOC132266353 [Cornus florida]
MKEIRSRDELKGSCDEDEDVDEEIVELQLELGECADSFNLENAVCNHGFFMMAPNRWIPSKKTLERPLRLANSITSLTVSIQQPHHHHHYLLVRVHGVHHLSSQDQQAILIQVARMLRISTKDERDVQKFHSMHPEAKKRGFGRIFRSPTLFEDAIKSILLCNCTWMRTLKMSRELCKLQLELSSGLICHDVLIGRKKGTTNSIGRRKGLKRKLQATYKNSSDDEDAAAAAGLLGNFPSPQELAKLNAKMLEERCNLGYRATRILNFSKRVASGKLELKEPEDLVNDYDYDNHDDTNAVPVPYLQLQQNLMKVKGFGPFACTNVLMCSGYYRQVPKDSETIRHCVQIHGRKNCNKKTIGAIIQEIYGKYSPFQCLAYWFELLDYYEAKHGRLSELPNSSYGIVTGSIDMSQVVKKIGT